MFSSFNYNSGLSRQIFGRQDHHVSPLCSIVQNLGPASKHIIFFFRLLSLSFPNQLRSVLMDRLSFHQSERSNSRDSCQLIVVRQSSGYHGQSTCKYIIVRQLSGKHQIAKKLSDFSFITQPMRLKASLAFCIKIIMMILNQAILVN